jgi:ribosome-binding protein aMBF1 (putative translation factor)
MADAASHSRPRDVELTPEQRAALEEVRARHRTPEARAEDARVREAVQQEFPPLEADESLRALLAAFRTERERQGLSLTDVSERTGMERSVISRLELGKIPNPTYQTLRTYARALGKSLAWVLGSV